MFEVAFSMAIFVDIVFWSTLATGSIDAFVIILHALNGILMMVELFMNSMVFAPGHVIFVWITLLGYMVEVWVWHAVGKVWAYPFLDFSNKLAAAYYPALFVAATATFYIGLLLTKLRDCKKQAKVYPNIHQEEPFIF